MRPSISATKRSQSPIPHALMIMHPRVGDCSARSASRTTAWYHSGKSSARVTLSACIGEESFPGLDRLAAHAPQRGLTWKHVEQIARDGPGDAKPQNRRDRLHAQIVRLRRAAFDAWNRRFVRFMQALRADRQQHEETKPPKDQING